MDIGELSSKTKTYYLEWYQQFRPETALYEEQAGLFTFSLSPKNPCMALELLIWP